MFSHTLHPMVQNWEAPKNNSRQIKGSIIRYTHQSKCHQIRNKNYSMISLMRGNILMRSPGTIYKTTLERQNIASKSESFVYSGSQNEQELGLLWPSLAFPWNSLGSFVRLFQAISGLIKPSLDSPWQQQRGCIEVLGVCN